MNTDHPKPAPQTFIAYELADKIGEHMLAELLKQDPSWSAEFDEGEHLLVPPHADGSALAITLPLYAAINAVFSSIVQAAPAPKPGDGSIHVKAMLDTLAHLQRHSTEPFYLDRRDSSKLMSPLLTAATVLDRLERGEQEARAIKAQSLAGPGFRIRPPQWENRFAEEKCWISDTAVGRFCYGVGLDGNAYWQSPGGEYEAGSQEEARRFAEQDHAERMIDLAGVERVPSDEHKALLRERDLALHACQAAAESIRRFPGSIHDRAMGKLEKALTGQVRDFCDPDVDLLEARIKALTALAHPEVCPITGRQFFTEIDGEPTYGGPFDSYTIPKLDDDKHFICRQFDHDAGHWKDWSVDTGLVLAQEGDLADPEDAAPAGKASEPGQVHPIERLWRSVGLPEHFLGNGGTNHKLYALYAAIFADVGLGGLLECVQTAVREAEGKGLWKTCSGCHESEDGHDSGHYPYSQAFGCKLGGGCSECGGIGAIWDTTNWSDFAEHFLKNEDAGLEGDILSRVIRSAADEARNAFLRDVDANDQIGALNVALDAAFALALEGGAVLHKDPIAGLMKRSTMLAMMLDGVAPQRAEVIRRLDLGAIELSRLYNVDPHVTLFGLAAALIRDLIDPWHPGETAPIDRHILVFGKPTDIDGLKFTAPGVHTAYWDAIDERFCIKGATWLGPFIDPLFWREEPISAGLGEGKAAEAKTRQAGHA